MTALWYIARGTGIVSVIMLSGSVALGIITSLKWTTKKWPRFVTQGLHKNVSLLSVVFLAIHIVTTVFDPVSPVHLFNAIVPFSGRYRPIGIGLGVIAFDLLLALIVTSLLKKQIGLKVWRAVHWSAYACWPFAMLHGLRSGTDAHALWAEAVYAGCAAAVLTAIAWRIDAATAEPTPTTRRRTPTAA
jgi:sulfoxide reductase heme-binding subunit YedZ